MTGDLPDYTKYVTPQPQQPPTITGFGTKAETVTKKSTYAQTGVEAGVVLDAPAAGKKTGLIMVVGSNDIDGGYIYVMARQGGVMQYVLDRIHIPANDTKVLVFPCWVPEQDVGDGVNSNISVTVFGGGCAANPTIFVIYYEE